MKHLTHTCQFNNAILLVVIAVIHFTTAPVHAHRINLWASITEPGTIEGKAYFSGSAPAKHIDILVHNDQGNLIATTQTDSNGLFQFQYQEYAKLIITASTKDAHQAQFTILTGDEPDNETQPQITNTDATNQNISNRILLHQINQLRQELNEYEQKIRLRDVIGAIGYIFGLTGIAFYLMTRQRLHNQKHSES